MTDLTLPAWIDATAAIIITELPLQSRDSATLYTSSYLSNVGGWVPDNILIPQGPGNPANGFTPQQAANAITAEQLAQVYDLNFLVTIQVEVQVASKLVPGLTLNQAAGAVLSQVTQFVTTEINNSDLPMRVDSVNAGTPISGGSGLGGATTTGMRVSIQADIISGFKVIDYKANTLNYARRQYNLDTTWNVGSVYTELNQPIAVIIQKYTSTSYSTLDTGTTTFYIFTVSENTQVVLSGSSYTP